MLEFNFRDDIQSIINFLESHVDYQNPHKYTILEYFPIGKGESYIPNAYELYNLTMEYEDGYIICDDGEKILSEYYTLSLHAFHIDSVEYIGFLNDRITITFSSGYIQIYY